jgi:RNA polymerase sigma-70 factor (ECF subfamily)
MGERTRGELRIRHQGCSIRTVEIVKGRRGAGDVVASPMQSLPRADGMDDINLALALLSGDSRAPIKAWARFTPMVRGIVIRGLGPSAELEDLTQEIFYRLFARIGTLRKPEALRQFVASFAIRVVRWEHRRRRARRWVKLTPTGRIPDFPTEDRLRYDLWDAGRVCGKLLPRQREVMFLRYVEGRTLPEMAQALRLSLATIKRALWGAHRRVSSLHLGG